MAGMTRDEVLRFALEVARDEYTRAQGRLSLIETKASLVALTVGIFATLLVTLGPEHLPERTLEDGLMFTFLLLALGTSLAFSLSASLLVKVNPPTSAEKISKDCVRLIGETGDTSKTIDAAEAEGLVGDMSAAYLLAAGELSGLLEERVRKVFVAQVALLFGFVLTVVWLGLPALAKAITLFNH